MSHKWIALSGVNLFTYLRCQGPLGASRCMEVHIDLYIVMAKVILCQSDLFNFIWSLETSDIPLATSTFLSFLKKKTKQKRLFISDILLQIYQLLVKLSGSKCPLVKTSYTGTYSPQCQITKVWDSRIRY